MIGRVSLPSRKGKPAVKVKKWCDRCEQILLVHGSAVKCPNCKTKHRTLHTILPGGYIEY